MYVITKKEKVMDKEIFSLINKEKNRQNKGIELIASENYASKDVRKACGSLLTNKYAEGYPSKRYYGGCEVVDKIENLAIERAKELFGCVDEYSMRTEAAKVLEIDHRTPQVRWTTNEDDNSNLTDEQIKAKFMLLTSPNNLLKSRVCEECVKTNKRGKGYKEIEFWYVGDENYSDDIGCVGCFWHNPSKWRKELNKKIKEK